VPSAAGVERHRLFFTERDVEMDFKRHLESAWTLTLDHLVILVFMTLVMFTVSCLTLGILAPVTMAGYTQAILLLVRDGREPRIQDLFGQMNLFLPLLIFALAVVIAIGLGIVLLVIPGVLAALAVAFFCLYLLPLMTDRQMRLADALRQSARMAVDDVLVEHVVVVVLFLGITAIGGSVFIGSLFTQPFATVFLMSVYLERTAAVPRGGAQGAPPMAPGDRRG
jgi:hypothetical protein